jgi:hypothetical protein
MTSTPAAGTTNSTTVAVSATVINGELTGTKMYSIPVFAHRVSKEIKEIKVVDKYIIANASPSSIALTNQNGKTTASVVTIDQYGNEWADATDYTVSGVQGVYVYKTSGKNEIVIYGGVPGTDVYEGKFDVNITVNNATISKRTDKQLYLVPITMVGGAAYRGTLSAKQANDLTVKKLSAVPGTITGLIDTAASARYADFELTAQIKATSSDADARNQSVKIPAGLFTLSIDRNATNQISPILASSSVSTYLGQDIYLSADAKYQFVKKADIAAYAVTASALTAEGIADDGNPINPFHDYTGKLADGRYKRQAVVMQIGATIPYSGSTAVIATARVNVWDKDNNVESIVQRAADALVSGGCVIASDPANKTATIRATAGKITYSDLREAITGYVDSYNLTTSGFGDNGSTITVQIVVDKLVETNDGIHSKNSDKVEYKIDKNYTTGQTSTSGVLDGMILNAERGDTFVAKFTFVKRNGVAPETSIDGKSLEITFTVGQDKLAVIGYDTTATNNFRDLDAYLKNE